MIDPAAPPSVSPSTAGLTGSGTVLAAAGGNPALPGTFASLLAAGTAPAPATAVPAGNLTTPPGAEPVEDVARQDLAASAALPLPAGKVLPDLMPGLPAPASLEPTLPETPHPTAARLAPLLAAVRAARGPALRGDAEEASDMAAPAVPADADGAPEGATAALDTMILPFPQTPAAPAKAPAEPAWTAMEPPQTASTASALAAAPTAGPLPPAIMAQLRGEQLPVPAETRPAPTPATPTEERSLRLPAAAVAPTPVPFTLSSPAAPSAPTALHLRPVIDETSKVTPTRAADAPAAAQTVLPAPADASQAPATLVHVVAPAGASIHRAPGDSFAAVVDRLMAARDAARADSPAPPVALNLRHAEFGEVSVRFEHRADGLSVALASPDPDFARAVQAAAPSSGDTGTGFTSQGSQPGAGLSASSGQAGQSQQGQRGSAPTQPERSAAAPPADPAQSAARAEGAPARPRGIFA